jgi:protein involved in polysaccharide export with SLBB domain
MAFLHWKYIICLATVLLIAGGCAVHPLAKSNPAAINSQPLDSVRSEPVSHSHQIESGDLLEITVYENDDLHSEVRVPEDGHIPFPLLGNLQVIGMTVLQLDSLITHDLGEKYIYDPLVTVVIKEYRQRNIYVTGEVKKPGGYPFEPGLTVRKAISLAGGFTDKASRGKITITRIVNGEEVTIPSSLDDQIREEDIITIPRSFF